MFLSIEDLHGLHRDGSMEVVAGQFPMCWEIEVMDNGSADEDDGDSDSDIYARYVLFISFCLVCEPNCRVSIRMPHTEMSLSFNGGYAGAQVSRQFFPRIIPHSDER